MNMFTPRRQPIMQAPPPPPVATIDDAAMREEYSRKVRRRKGHGANVYDKTGGGASVASRVLLG